MNKEFLLKLSFSIIILIILFVLLYKNNKKATTIIKDVSITHPASW